MNLVLLCAFAWAATIDRGGWQVVDIIIVASNAAALGVTYGRRHP